MYIRIIEFQSHLLYIFLCIYMNWLVKHYVLKCKESNTNYQIQESQYMSNFVPAHPASFTHIFFSGMQSLYFSESQDAMGLQTCHEKSVLDS